MEFSFVKPGLVGGHCIEWIHITLLTRLLKLDINPKLLLQGEEINDSMGKFVAEQTILKLIKNNINPSKARVGILGLTFKKSVLI